MKISKVIGLLQRFEKRFPEIDVAVVRGIVREGVWVESNIGCRECEDGKLLLICSRDESEMIDAVMAWSESNK